MRLSTGIDIINLNEAGSLLKSVSALKKLLTSSEIDKSSPEHIAGRIAIKEAVIKAAGLKPDSWKQIRISTLADGKPHVTLLGITPLPTAMDVSVSHHGENVVAVAVLLYEND